MADSPNPSSRKGKPAASENLLKDDVALRIAEAANDAKYLYKALMAGNAETAYSYLYELTGSFYSLYDSTVDNLDNKYRQLAEEGGEFEGDERESVENFFEDPIIWTTDQDGNQVPDVRRSAERMLSFYRLYKKYLRKSGMLELQKYEHHEEGFGRGKE